MVGLVLLSSLQTSLMYRRSESGSFSGRAFMIRSSSGASAAVTVSAISSCKVSIDTTMTWLSLFMMLPVIWSKHINRYGSTGVSYPEDYFDKCDILRDQGQEKTAITC